MEPIYLPIDSKNKISYQFIHIDIDRKYGIACIFDFENQSPGKFTITHIKEIFMDSSHKEHKVNIIEVSKEVKPPNNDYKFKLKLKLTQNVGTGTSDFKVTKFSNGHNFEIKGNNLPPKFNNLIDVDVENQDIRDPKKRTCSAVWKSFL